MKLLSAGFLLILFLFFVASPLLAAERLATIFDFWQGTGDVAVLGNRALLTIPSHGLVLMDLSDPENPVPIQTFREYEGANHVELLDSLFCVAFSESGLVFRLNDEDSLLVVDEFERAGDGAISLLQVQPPYLFVQDTRHWGDGIFQQTAFAIGVYEKVADSLNYIGTTGWGYGDVIEPFMGIAYAPPYCYLSISELYTYRDDIIGDEGAELIELPLGSFVAVVDNYLYSTFANDLRIYSMADPANPEYLQTVSGEPGGKYRINGNQMLAGLPFGYENYPSALTLLDISDPANPELVGEYQGYTNSNPYPADSLVVVSGMQVLSLEDPFNWQVVGSYENSGRVDNIRLVDENLAVVKLRNEPWQIIDTSDPSSPTLPGDLYPDFDGDNWRRSGDLLFAIHRDPARLDIYSLEDPLVPSFQTSWTDSPNLQTNDFPKELDSGLYALNSGSDLDLLDLSNLSAPALVAHHEDLKMGAVHNRRGLRSTAFGLQAWNLYQPTNPVLTSEWQDTSLGYAGSTTLHNHHAVTICGKWNLSPDGEFGWIDYTLVCLDYTDWSQPDIQWQRDLGSNTHYALGPRYGRYQLLVDKTDPDVHRFQVYDAEGPGPRGPWVEIDGQFLDAVVDYPSLLLAEAQQLSIYDLSGEMPVWVDDPQSTRDLPTRITLLPAYPNPFNAGTMLRYKLPTTSHATIRVFDVLGRQVRLLEDCYQASGAGQVYWDGRSDSGSPVSSGVYLLRLESADQTAVRKVTLIK